MKLDKNKHKVVMQRGFTLVEVMLATVMLTFVLVITYGLWQQVSDTYTSNFETTQNLFEVQQAMGTLTEELREARDGEDGAYTLVTTDDDELAFHSDVNGDLRTDRVRYFMDGTTLKRGVIAPVGVPAVYNPGSEVVTDVARFVRNGTDSIYSYYDENWPGDVINNPIVEGERLLRTRFVTITLTIDLTEDFGAQAVTLKGSTQLRNLKDNL